MKHTNLSQSGSRRAWTVLSVGLLIVALEAPAFGQAPQYPQYPQYPQQYPAQAPPAGVPQQPAPQPLMAPQQLDDLVAPIALYPDPLLGQVLAASTYPLELVEADQFVQQNTNLRGQDLMNVARQQNWDPSVQAMVAFPDVLTLLTRDVRWTTDLGNAFLAQQQDVMAAVQRMRARAQSNGRLSSNAQQTVTDQTQNGQNAVVIEPANPGYIDVPQYNPDYVWGPPAWGYYPPLWYPPVAYGYGFEPAIYLGGFFPGWGVGWGGWGLGWGWGCGWFGGGLFVNVGFFSHWGFHGFFGSHFAGGFGAGRLGWEHDPFHRAGVPYANRGVAARFSSSARFAQGRTARANTFSARSGISAGGRGLSQSRAGGASGGGWQHFGGNTAAASRGFAAPREGQSFRGNSSAGFNNAPRGSAGFNNAPRGSAGFNNAPRSFAAPRSSASRSYSSNSRSYAGGGFSAPRSSGGGGFSGGGARSFSGGGGRSFGGGGGHSGGGGHGGGRR